jgi:Bacterial TSP3 repeat
LVDTDGDGFDDATEIAEGSDPNVGGSQKPLTRVRSAMVSMLNAAPQEVPAILANSAVSKAVSYLNAATEPLPPALDNAAASKAVSYLNAATEPLPVSRAAQSGQVSYRNNP